MATLTATDPEWENFKMDSMESPGLLTLGGDPLRCYVKGQHIILCFPPPYKIGDGFRICPAMGAEWFSEDVPPVIRKCESDDDDADFENENISMRDALLCYKLLSGKETRWPLFVNHESSIIKDIVRTFLRGGTP